MESKHEKFLGRMENANQIIYWYAGFYISILSIAFYFLAFDMVVICVLPGLTIFTSGFMLSDSFGEVRKAVIKLKPSS